MNQDFPQANARLAEVARNWAEGEVSQETWRRERRNILREICNKRVDVQGSAPLVRKSPAKDRTMPDLPAVVPVAATASPAASQPVVLDAEQDDVLTLAILLIVILAGAITLFFLA